MRVRLAVALGLLLLIGAALATFLPTSPDGASCGTWMDPAWSSSKTAALVQRASETRTRAENAGLGDIAAQAEAIAEGAIHSHAVCSSALGTRRTWTLVLLVLAVVVPVAVIYVSRRPAGVTSSSA